MEDGTQYVNTGYIINRRTAELHHKSLELSENTTCDTNMTTNGTYVDKDHLNEGDIIFLVYYYGILMLISLINVIGNSMVITAFIRHKSLRVPGNYFIFSLAMSDLAFGLVYPVYNILHVEDSGINSTLGGWHVCTYVITITLALLSTSSFNLVGITIVRFVSIKNPLTFHSKVTHVKAVLAALSVWIIMFSLTMAVFLRPKNQNEDFDGICRYELFLNVHHLAFTSVISFFLPISIMTPLYAYMALQAWKQARQICAMEETQSQNCSFRRSIFKKEMKMFRMTALLLGYFTFAWMPYIIYEVVFMTCGCEVNRYVRATVRLVLHSNSAVNIWIYTARLKEVRHILKQDCLRLPCCKLAFRCSNKENDALNRMNSIAEYGETIGGLSSFNKSYNGPTNHMIPDNNSGNNTETEWYNSTDKHKSHKMAIFSVTSQNKYKSRI